MSLDLDKLRATFFEEAKERMADTEAAFLALESAPQDRETIDRIFRAVHSIKGGSGTFGFSEITRLAHAMESLLDELRAGRAAVTAEHVDVLLGACDQLGVLVAARVEGQPSTLALDPILTSLQRLIDARFTSSRASYRVRVQPHQGGAREPLAVLTALAGAGTLRQTTVDYRQVPPLTELEPGALHLAFDLVLETDRSEAELTQLLAGLDGDVSVERLVPLADASAPAARAVAPAPRALVAGGAVRGAPQEASSIRVPVARLDGLMNLVGELVIAQSMIADVLVDFTPDKLATLAEAAAVLERHTRELQEQVMSVRMVPVGTVFGRFPRVVRDVAIASGKEVELVLHGEDTELDKSVVERIVDPLTHLVRNCIDHGLEQPEARQQAGKPRSGTVTMSAYTAGGSVFVEVRDDGRGLDTARIRKKAIESGLITPDVVLSDEQVHQLIFAPGFSTAEKVSDLSGRGVGMDVVKSSVESMGGTVTLGSEPGRGSRFVIRLPLTLAILDGQYVAIADRLFVVPLVAIRESIRLEASQVHAVMGKGTLAMIRGEAVPLVSLRRLFGLEDGVERLQRLVMVVEAEGSPLAFEVDALLAQSQVVIKNIETHYRRVEGILGATIMGNGQVAMILDVPSLYRSSVAAPTRAPAGGRAA
jgi:two-component system chemotaxis sensor kinase CheA